MARKQGKPRRTLQRQYSAEEKRRAVKNTKRMGVTAASEKLGMSRYAIPRLAGEGEESSDG